MKFTDLQLEEAYADLKQQASPFGALVGALIGSVPAMALYAFFAHMGAILYVFILIPACFIGLSSQFTGRVYLFKHRLSVGAVAGLVHTVSIYHFNYKTEFYYIVPLIIIMAIITSKRRLNRLQRLVVDMETEGSLKNE